MVLQKLKNKISGSEPETSTEGIDEIGSENQSILMGIIAQLRPGCDLSRITLPTFILERKSMLERISNAFMTPDILIDANNTEDAVQRFLLVVKWYLSSWHIAPKAVKKPLNPVLGEIFSCYWDNLPEESKAYYVAEQTSHHPPESSYFYLIPEQKIRVDGVLIPKSKFLGNSSAAMMEGVAQLTFGSHNGEIYSVTQPNIYCRGILFGKLRYELGDHMLVRCEKSGMEADIEFKTKGFISGDYDTIEGKIKCDGKTIFLLSGKWNGLMEIEEAESGVKETFYDTAKSSISSPKTRPLSEQKPYESQKLWHNTLVALEKGDHEAATTEKFIVENKQRQEAKVRSERGDVYKPQIFANGPLNDVPHTIDADIDISSNDADAMLTKLLDVHQII